MINFAFSKLMKKSQYMYSKQPLGKFLSGMGKNFLHALNTELNYLDIKRSYYALILIAEGRGNLTQKDLADLLESDKVSVVRIIDYLSETGYVKREKVASDKRKYRLTLTEKAENELPVIKKAMAGVIQKALKGLSAKKIDELYDTLNTIKKNLN